MMFDKAFVVSCLLIPMVFIGKFYGWVIYYSLEKDLISAIICAVLVVFWTAVLMSAYKEIKKAYLKAHDDDDDK